MNGLKIYLKNMDLKCIFLLLLVYKPKSFPLIKSKEGEGLNHSFPFPSFRLSKINKTGKNEKT
ncbi:hypothetical protein A3K73_01520 [Candidatus Pacearchaeota archaeon RBG_13_36_9]|nr:MAG: hypothetical protein A3K73_01520 [Candidatus Pacearchaeota archaeon RBG_13_36_9]